MQITQPFELYLAMSPLLPKSALVNAANAIARWVQFALIITGAPPLLDSTLPCFAALGEQTAGQLRDRFQQGLTQAAVEEHVERLVDTSLGSNWTRLYDSVRRHPPFLILTYLTTALPVSILLAIYSVTLFNLMGFSGGSATLASALALYDPNYHLSMTRLRTEPVNRLDCAQLKRV